MASRTTAAILLLALVSALVFLNAQPDEFVWESSDFIFQPAVTGDLRSALRLFLPSGWQEYGQATLEDYRPLATVTYHFDHALWGRSPRGYIWTNAAIHVVNLLLVYLLAATVLASPVPTNPSLQHSIT
ncbi:MAG: hypothetical protein FJ290_33030, partial [Planctomycetes bacterium]|nr:hypothetical protein [Planctomycetota bacterium]